MGNIFIEIVHKAEQNNWCTIPYCTTCGNTEIRNELRNIAGLGGSELANMLSEIAPSEIMKLPNWTDCIRLSFFEITYPGHQEKVLNSWLINLENQVYFADPILFYVVRTLPFGLSVGKNWVVKCVSMATETKNESLVESLIWTLKEKIREYPDLLHLAQQLTSSQKIRNALLDIEK